MLLLSFEEDQPWTYGSAAPGRFARQKLELPSVSRLHPRWVNNHALPQPGSVGVP
jgi:hypothetical protein